MYECLNHATYKISSVKVFKCTLAVEHNNYKTELMDVVDRKPI